VASLLDNLGTQITQIKNDLSSGKITTAIKDELNSNMATLQSWYNTVLAKGGLISPQEEASANAALLAAKQAQMEKDAVSATNKLIAIGIITVVLIAGIIIIKRMSK